MREVLCVHLSETTGSPLGFSSRAASCRDEMREHELADRSDTKGVVTILCTSMSRSVRPGEIAEAATLVVL